MAALWSAGRQRSAQGTFTGETASGWQTVTFATPVAVTAGTTYVASYLAPERALLGHLRGLRRGGRSTTRRCTRWPTWSARTASTPTARRSVFPSSSFNATNYWVDVLFAPGG